MAIPYYNAENIFLIFFILKFALNKLYTTFAPAMKHNWPMV